MMPYAILSHLLALTLLACGGIGGTILHFALAGAARTNPAAAPALGALMPRFAIAAQLGSLLMLLTGILLLWSRGWADWGHGWLTAKIVLWLLISASGPLIARPAAMQLRAAFALPDPAARGAAVSSALGRLQIFHLSALVGLIAIITLGVLKPS